jgi:hypothetical protein
MPASRASPSAIGSSAATDCQGPRAAAGSAPAPQSHRLFTAGAPRSPRARFTGWSCSSICSSFSSACQRRVSAPAASFASRSEPATASGDSAATDMSSSSRAHQRSGRSG